MSSVIPNELIITLLEHYLALDPDQITIVRKVSGDFCWMCWVESSQGNFLLRLSHPQKDQGLFYEVDMLRREVDILRTIRAQTTVPTPEIIVSNFEHNLINCDFIITESPTGILYSDIRSLNHAQHDRVYFQLGEYLRQLHAILGSGYGYGGQQTALAPQATWKETFALMWHELIKNIVACGFYTKQDMIGLVDLFDDYQHYFDHHPIASLLQMGIHKENIMVDKQGNVTSVLQFGLALWGDPELEFAALDCAGIWASAFWDGYGQPRLDDLGSRARRKFYTLYEVQKNIPLALKRHDDLEEAEQYKQTTLTIATNLAASQP